MRQLQARSLPHHREVWEVCRHHATLLHRQASSPQELHTHPNTLKRQLSKRLLWLQDHHREAHLRAHHVLVLHLADPYKADHLVQIPGQALDSRTV
jgi:hypothetical protein